MKLLILDDDANQLFSLKVALKTRGHSVTAAKTGDEALQRLSREAAIFDAVLTDYAMPGMSGMELLGHIQKKFPNMPVIMMTAHGKKELAIEALRNGCNGFIEKPFTLEELIGELERVVTEVNRKRLAEETAERLREGLGEANDKLTIIGGSVEVALIEMERANEIAVTQQLRSILALAHKIGEINSKMMEKISRVPMTFVEKTKQADNTLSSQ